MKHLWLILSAISLSAQSTEIIHFKKGSYGNTLKGKLISIKLNQQLNSDNGFTSEVVFQPNNPKGVPLLLSGGVSDNDKFIFDVKDIDKIVSRGIYTTTVLFSKKIQKEYLNREEIELIISEADERKSQRIQRGDKIFNVTYYCIIPLGLFFVIIFGDYP
jgi:hypothetical protein